MHWLLANWELMVPLGGAIAVAAFEAIQKIRQKEALPLRAHLFVVLALLAGISLTLIAQDRPEIPHLVGHLRADYGDDNRYVEDLIEGILYPLQDSLKRKGFQTYSLDDTNKELLGEIQRCGRGDEIWAIDYGIPWQNEFKDYGKANADCAKNGVLITRVFIGLDEILMDSAKGQILWGDMQDQSKSGIKVKFVKEHDLSAYNFYRQNTKGMADFKFRGRPVLMVEAEPYWEAIRKREPPKLDVTWDSGSIQKEENYFIWLKGLSEVRDISNGSTRPF